MGNYCYHYCNLQMQVCYHSLFTKINKPSVFSLFEHKLTEIDGVKVWALITPSLSNANSVNINRILVF